MVRRGVADEPGVWPGASVHRNELGRRGAIVMNFVGSGLRVRHLRNSRSWTIEQAAECMDLDPTHLAKIEAGTINVSFVTLVRLARGLELAIAELFT
jgi:DNA-binding XRE family transcriptional regulator